MAESGGTISERGFTITINLERQFEIDLRERSKVQGKYFGIYDMQYGKYIATKSDI
jgi:hypothetical protein